MRKGNFGMMPVGENDRMIGAISDRDIAIRAVADGKDPSTRGKGRIPGVTRFANPSNG